jgi:hypothetical protein
VNTFDVTLDHAHHAIAVIDGVFAPGDDRHGRIADFLFRIPQHAETFSLGLNIGWMREVGRIDRAVK